MPKEITHWIIADGVCEGLKGGPLGDAAIENPNCLMVGAVFHDALFYLPRNRGNLPFLAVADRLHGEKGEDTYRIIRDLAFAIKKSKKPGPLMAFLVGAASHIQADSLFHPLVFAMTGDYFDPDPIRKTKAVRAHRRLEALLDLYFCKGDLEVIKGYSLGRYLNKAEAPCTCLFAHALATMKMEEGLHGLDDAIGRAFKTFAFMQRCFVNKCLSYMLFALEPGLPLSLKEVTALFYPPQILRDLKLLPCAVKGQMKQSVYNDDSLDLGNLLKDAIEEGVSFCRGIEPSLMGAGPFELPEHGPSLSGFG